MFFNKSTLLFQDITYVDLYLFLDPYIFGVNIFLNFFSLNNWQVLWEISIFITYNK